MSPEGHEVVELRDVLNIESLDEETFAYARQQGMFMITCNRDDFFGPGRRQPASGPDYPISPPNPAG
jgi:hypothetical protein